MVAMCESVGPYGTTQAPLVDGKARARPHAAIWLGPELTVEVYHPSAVECSETASGGRRCKMEAGRAWPLTSGGSRNDTRVHARDPQDDALTWQHGHSKDLAVLASGRGAFG